MAVEQEWEGKNSLAEFIANRGNGVVDKALCIAKEFGEAEAKLAQTKKTHFSCWRTVRAAKVVTEAGSTQLKAF